MQISAALGCFTDVVRYGDEERLDPAVKSVFVDMSGDSPMTAHHHFKDSMVSSWCRPNTLGSRRKTAQGHARHTSHLLLRPADITKRDEEWGRAVLERAFTASIGVTQATASNLDIVARNGAEQAASSWNDLLENKLSGSTGLIISL